MVGGHVRGSGILVSERHVVTCAHVLGEPESSEADDGSGDGLAVDFPALRRSKVHDARVMPGGWFPARHDGRADIAVLELRDAVVDAPPAVLRGGFGRGGDDVWVCGYPDGIEHGVWAASAIVARGGPGQQWMQLTARQTTGQRIIKGFSGAGVMAADDGSVVGIIVAEHTEPTAKVAWMIPTETLARYWSALHTRVVIAAGAVTAQSVDLRRIAAASSEPGRLDVFAVAGHGDLLRRWWTNDQGWSMWHHLPGPGRVRDVAAASPGIGQLECAVIDAHGRAQMPTAPVGEDNGVSWRRLSNPDTDSPILTAVAAVAMRPEGHREVFAITEAGELVHRWKWNDDPWSGWHQMTSTPLLDIAAASPAEGKLSCVAVDRYGRTAVSNWPDKDERWVPWHRMSVPRCKPDLSSSAMTAITSASPMSGHQDVIAVTRAGEMVHRQLSIDHGWERWNRVPSPATPVVDIAAASCDEGHLTCMAVDVKGRLQCAVRHLDSWTGWTLVSDLTGPGVQA